MRVLCGKLTRDEDHHSKFSAAQTGDLVELSGMQREST
jgi:hypothetical protein